MNFNDFNSNFSNFIFFNISKKNGTQLKFVTLWTLILFQNSFCKIVSLLNIIFDPEMIEVVFEGRADLVMAFRDDGGNGMLQVIDMKTTDCLHGFNYSNPAQGNNLQKINGDVLDRFATTEHEKSILESYKHQLTLYSMVLEAMELEKPTGEQRQVLPPAILVAASGKSIEMTVEDYELCKTHPGSLPLLDVSKLIEWARCSQFRARRQSSASIFRNSKR